MEEKLQRITQRLAEVRRQLADPAVYGDPALLKKLGQEEKELAPVAQAYDEYCRARQDEADARDMLADPELRQLAQEELERARAAAEERWNALRLALLPRDPNDGKNVILELRSGTGGEEAALFAADLLRMYTLYAERRGYTLTVVSSNVTELGGVKEAVATVEGEGAFSRLKFEAGTHRVQRVPETESSGRIQTSAATVAVMPEAEEVELTIDPKDLQIDTYRSSGAGGQHVNKTESAIRITHLPTGTVVECQDERSQYKNKDRAMKILRSRLYEAEREKQTAAQAAARKSQVGSGDRSGKIRTYNFPQNRVTDHRLVGENKNFNLSAVLSGELDALVDALTMAQQASALQAEENE
ncbi:MAG: peptide chain release factor 1 [Oscillospiraceae bacterium]|nr:peptide chain release factor 1 [Oscillospiraceae bacterium]